MLLTLLSSGQGVLAVQIGFAGLDDTFISARLGDSFVASRVGTSVFMGGLGLGSSSAAAGQSDSFVPGVGLGDV